jgi:hypothetical protein
MWGWERRRLSDGHVAKPSRRVFCSFLGVIIMPRSSRSGHVQRRQRALLRRRNSALCAADVRVWRMTLALPLTAKRVDGRALLVRWSERGEFLQGGGVRKGLHDVTCFVSVAAGIYLRAPCGRVFC